MEEERLIPLPEVSSIAGIKRSEIYERISNNTFPKPTKLGTRSVRWSRTEILQWVRDRLAERNQVAA